MKRIVVMASGFAVMTALCAASTDAWASPVNIALGATVSVVATDSASGTGYNNGTSGNLQNITNGTILPDATAYNSTAAINQALEWNGNGYIFQITLSGTFDLTGLIVDADDNDAYNLQYHNLSNGQWDALYTAPIVSEGAGIRTRPSTSNQNSIYTLPSSVITDALRISGGTSNDNYTYGGVGNQGGYAVAQVEAFGSQVPSTPLPSSWTMMMIGLAVFGFASYSRRPENGLAS